MGVHITGRHVDLTDDLRAYIERKVERLEKHADRLEFVEAVIDKNRYLHRAEIRLKAGIIGMTVTASDRDPKRAVDLMLDKVERRLAKEMDLLKKGSKHTTRVPKKPLAALGTEATVGIVDEETGDEIEPANFRRGRRGEKLADAGLNGRSPRTRAAATLTVEPVWLEKLGLRVFNRGEVAAERISVEEAAERLFFEDETFLCFTNAETGVMNVIYRRKDGNFAVMEMAEAE